MMNQRAAHKRPAGNRIDQPRLMAKDARVALNRQIRSLNHDGLRHTLVQHSGTGSEEFLRERCGIEEPLLMVTVARQSVAMRMRKNADPSRRTWEVADLFRLRALLAFCEETGAEASVCISRDNGERTPVALVPASEALREGARAVLEGARTSAKEAGESDGVAVRELHWLEAEFEDVLVEARPGARPLASWAADAAQERPRPPVTYGAAADAMKRTRRRAGHVSPVQRRLSGLPTSS